MGLLDDILKQVAGGSLTSGDHSTMLDTVVGMLTDSQSGGIPGLLESFKRKGLGDIFSSWISRGENLPVSPDQIQQVLGKRKLADAAQKMGLSQADAADTLSKLLPQVVDKLTPKGDIEPSDLLGEGLNALKKLFG
jgi:uncharacterized protein YidB (DUF937 family)